jgi:predicted secreted protein
MKDLLKLTPREAESMGIELVDETEAPIPAGLRDLPMHEQVVGELREEDLVESMTGEVTEESREEVEEAIGDLQEDAAEAEGT